MAGSTRRGVCAGLTGLSVFVLITVAPGATRAASAAPAFTLSGTVVAAGEPVAGTEVAIAVGTTAGVTTLADATADETGTFQVTVTLPESGVVYVDAVPAGDSALRLLAVVGVLGSDEMARQPIASVTVNELTTVAAAFALAQFVGETGVSGPSPGLENAAATTFNLADSQHGTPGAVVTNANNGENNETLATLNSLANLVAVCGAAPAGQRCSEVLQLATPTGEAAPAETFQAIVNLARNPTLSAARLYALSLSQSIYEPSLNAPPDAWLVALLYTDEGLYASGRIAIDAKGNVWSSNNWAPGTQEPSTVITVLDPVGNPTLGSPISGGGMKGGAWGISIDLDGIAWIPSFGGAAMSKYSADGTPLSPNSGYTDGNLNHPQGTAVDQKGNVWIANNYGPESAPGEGNVVVYPSGDPSKAIVITGGGLNHPFAVQIDGLGNAWVDNAGLGGAKLVNTRAAILSGKFGGSVTVIGPDFKPTSYSPIESSSFRWPLGMALDSSGNTWIASYFNNTVVRLTPGGAVAATVKLPAPFFPWGVAVDGSDRVWVAGFSKPGVWLLCGTNTAACPPGSTAGTLLSPKLGFSNKAIQHLTSIQIDQSGNAWLSNNWSQLVPPVGGTGIVELIGLATPVCTPLIALPRRPSTDDPCPGATSTATPTIAADSSDDSDAWMWIAVAAGSLALAVAALALIFRARRSRGSESGGADGTDPPSTA